MGLLELLGLDIPEERVTGVVVRKEDGHIRRWWNKAQVTAYVVRPDEGIWAIGYGSSDLASKGDRVEMSYLRRIADVKYDHSSENAYQITGMKKLDNVNQG